MLGLSRTTEAFGMAELVSAYDTSISWPNKNTWQFAAPEEDVQRAWATDSDVAYTKFVAQYVTYSQLSLAEIDPTWQVVTAYYAAFHAAGALLSLTGRLKRRLVVAHPLVGGVSALWTFTSQAVGGGVGNPYVTVTATKGGVGSHRATWGAAARLFMDVSVVGGAAARDKAVLASVADLITRAPTLSDFRNQINYNADELLWTRGPWPCLLRDLTTSHDVESAVLGNVKKDEQRLELVALACGSLLKQLVGDYHDRVQRPDLRHHRRRRERLRLLEGSAVGPSTEIIHR